MTKETGLFPWDENTTHIIGGNYKLGGKKNRQKVEFGLDKAAFVVAPACASH